MQDIAILQPELERITDIELRTFVITALEKAPPNFWSIPASTSGKYHPAFASNTGGLIRHTKVAAYLGKEFCECYNAAEYKPVVIAALLLHDIGKAMGEPHDVLASEWLLQLQATDPRWLESILISDAIKGVRWHMGPWATGAVSGRNCLELSSKLRQFPSDFSYVEQLVHLGDYASSRRALSIDFNKL